MNKVNITQQELKSYLRYDPETGKFYFLKTWGHAKAGAEAGYDHGHYYWAIPFRGKEFPRAHLAWLYVTGSLPPGLIDHINRDPQDDRFCNLRIATLAQNIRNSRLRRDNVSGVRGVYYEPKSKKWQTEIQHEKVRYFIGQFDTKEAAQDAWIAKARELDAVFYGV